MHTVCTTFRYGAEPHVIELKQRHALQITWRGNQTEIRSTARNPGQTERNGEKEKKKMIFSPSLRFEQRPEGKI
jgi:hypothetical protein